MSVALRKLMLRRRVEHFCRCEAFQTAWDLAFPHHDLITLRLKASANPFWDESWAAAAREYHEERKRNLLEKVLA